MIINFNGQVARVTLVFNVDINLKLAQHISKLTHISHSRAALNLKCFFTRDPEVLIKAYGTYVRPVLEYWIPQSGLHIILVKMIN